MKERVPLKVDGREVQVTHLDKILFPETRVPKGRVIDYYIRISRFILPHLQARPLTLKLFLNGISSKPQYIKNAPSFTPRWIRKASVARKNGGPRIHFILVNDLPSLVWAANLNNIEMHTLLARAPSIERPLLMIFDLDPGEPATILDCARVALWLQEDLEKLKLQAFVKSSGSKGLHICVPLNTPITYPQTSSFAKALAENLQERHPGLVVTEMSKAKRAGKVFVDYSQNARHKSTVCVYSMRARSDGPFVSLPMTWPELKKVLDKADGELFFYDPSAAVRICESSGDRFADVLNVRQKLPPLEAAAEKLSEHFAGKKSAGPAGPRSLRTYQQKRDFSRTSEPSGSGREEQEARSRSGAQAGEKDRFFVIQKHAASHLHYDFRLEMEGVLRSWAVPKGPPYQRGERRLAMAVEDHPLEYGRFEGTIPKGQYGGGTVMVWDLGTYRVKDGSPARGFHSGKLHLELRGKKLKGEWALVRGRQTDERGKEPWFLIKSGSSMRPLSSRQDDRSALTKRSMRQIADQNTEQWNSNR